MKKIAFITLLISFFIEINSCTRDRSISVNPIQSGVVIINGHINKYNGDYKTGNLIFTDAVTAIEKQEVFSIDSIGNFNTSFDLICTTMLCYLEIEKTIFSLYLVPGETYNLTINLGNPDGYSKGTPVFSGENSKLFNDVYELTTAVDAQFKKDRNKINLYHQSDTCDYQEFEKFCDDLLERKLAFLDEYCKQKEINQKARDLVTIDLAYEPAWSLICYPYTNDLRKRKVLPANFYQHLYNKYQINNPEAIGSNYYRMYISNIRNIMWEDYYLNDGIIDFLKKTQRFTDRELFLISKNLLNDTTITKTKEFTGFIDERRGEITQFTNKYLTKLLLDSVRYFPRGIGRDLIISQGISFFYLKDQTLSPSQDEWNRIDSLISNKNIYSYLKKIDQFNQAKAFKSINNKTNILPPLLKNEADRVFEKLIGKYSGKVVYIDFWATWCGPCRQEIPYAKVLSAHFAGQDVVFLNLCNRSDKKSWETIIKSEQLTGDQYLLSSDEYNLLSKIFNIQGVPTYALIDKKGNIVDKNAPRPSAGPMTIKAIESLLKKY
jgi:thiol-disulfide isomerase/thioredoxin